MTTCVVLFAIAMVVSIAGAGGDDGYEAPVGLRLVPALLGGVVVGASCRRALRKRITKAGSVALRTAQSAGSQGGVGGAWQPAAQVVALGVRR
ncbi:hypothetical protein [Streptomyces sirii]|uniref:hypothetical protein n=1 Tax=Streptomyces sirii TaxID=3127701 RepID=UPI003D36C527